MRGIVLSESVDLSKCYMGRPPYVYANAHLLRFCLTYWDKVDYPEHCHLPLESKSAAPFLDRSVMERSRHTSPFARATDNCLRAFEERERQDRGAWSICGHIDTSQLRNADVVQNRGAFLRLMRCLPVPAHEVPYDRIYEFKRRHDSERLALLDAVCELYLDSLKSPDPDFANKSAMLKLTKAIEDQLRVAKQSNHLFDLWDLEVRFNIPAAIFAGATLYGATGSWQSAVFGSALTIHFGPTFSLNAKAGDRDTPYAYIGLMNERLEW